MTPAEWSGLGFAILALGGGAAMSQLSQPPMWLWIVVVVSVVGGGACMLKGEHVEQREREARDA